MAAKGFLNIRDQKAECIGGFGSKQGSNGRRAYLFQN